MEAFHIFQLFFGAMRMDDNYDGTLGYEPNNTDDWQERPDHREPPLALESSADHGNHGDDDD